MFPEGSLYLFSLFNYFHAGFSCRGSRSAVAAAQSLSVPGCSAVLLTAGAAARQEETAAALLTPAAALQCCTSSQGAPNMVEDWGMDEAKRKKWIWSTGMRVGGAEEPQTNRSVRLKR